MRYKELLYYISKGQWRRARIYIEAHCIYYKIKLTRWINRLYLKIWPYILGFWILLCLSAGYLQFKHDYDLIENYAHIDALTSDYYTHWRTDGNPGKEPPKQ